MEVPAASEIGGEAQIHRLTERFDVKDGQLIRVVNRHGNVRIREVPLTAEAEVALTVQLEGGVDNPVRARVELRDDGVLHVGATSDRPLDDEPGFLRLDLTLAVPDRVALDVELDRGDFTMHGASYPVRLRGRSGDVRLATSGAVDVELSEGHVVYLPPRDGSPAGGRIMTSRAPVDVLMNDPAALNFAVVSGAAVTTDSPWLLQHRERDGRTWVFGEDGDGARLNIQTDEAPVRLVFEGIR